MTSYRWYLVCAAMLVIGLSSCQQDSSSQGSAAPSLTTVPSTDMATDARGKPVVLDGSFLGMYPGMAITAAPQEYLAKGKLTSGGSNASVYNISAPSGVPYGYFYLHPGSPSSIGKICILNRSIETSEGIRVGMSLDEIKPLLPEGYQVHGTPSDDRLLLSYGKIQLWLDYDSSDPDIDISTIPGFTRVKQIWIPVSS